MPPSDFLQMSCVIGQYWKFSKRLCPYYEYSVAKLTPTGIRPPSIRFRQRFLFDRRFKFQPYFGNTAFWTGETMFPNPKHAPTRLPQDPRYKQITFCVRGKLAPPECAVASWDFAVLRAAVPETAINKHGEFLLRKSKVWPAKNRKVSSPACYFILPKQASQRDFCVLVAAPTNP